MRFRVTYLRTDMTEKNPSPRSALTTISVDSWDEVSKMVKTIERAPEGIKRQVIGLEKIESVNEIV